MKKYFVISLIASVLSLSCNQKTDTPNIQAKTINSQTRIVSLNGTITEILCLSGYEKNLVAVDVTSNYPPGIEQLPKLGHSRNINVEGILSYNPDIIIGIEEQINPDILSKLYSSGKKVWMFKQQYSVEGTESLIKNVCDSLQKQELSEKIIEPIKQELSKVSLLENPPKVLFIYARGAGTLMAAGDNTQMKKIIELAGCQNAVKGFDDFKTLSPEILSESNPDVILMFTSGMESIEGENGLLNIPGVKNTNAGKNKAFIAMDGQYLSGFGPRLGNAVLELNTKIKELLNQSQDAP
jgi:iron complex transport system substrate-binding protein